MSKPQATQHIIRQLIVDHQLPAEFLNIAIDYFLPLADYITHCHQRRGQTLVVGINGAQGTGKSTLSALLKHLLQARQLECVVLSIDDLYLTRTQRTQLARDVHPLLQTRGVPGTHDLALGLTLLAALKAADADSCTRIPRFDKAQDDRCAIPDWDVHSGRVDVIILEGWCVGARHGALLGEPINSLEQQHDADGRWRRFIEQQLQEYQRLFKQFDVLVMLKAPSMESVIEWRTLQEHKLLANSHNKTRSGIMNEAEIRWFIMHYERLTRMMLKTLPEHADVVFDLDNQHHIVAAHYRQHNGDSAQ